MHRSFMLIAYYNLHLPEQIEEDSGKGIYLSL